MWPYSAESPSCVLLLWPSQNQTGISRPRSFSPRQRPPAVNRIEMDARGMTTLSSLSASPRDPLFLSFSHAETRRGTIPSSRRDGTNQPRVSAKRATLGCCAPRPVPCKGTTGTRNGRRMCGTPTGCLCLSAHTRGGAPSSLTPGCCVSPRWGEPE